MDKLLNHEPIIIFVDSEAKAKELVRSTVKVMRTGCYCEIRGGSLGVWIDMKYKREEPNIIFCFDPRFAPMRSFLNIQAEEKISSLIEELRKEINSDASILN